ncbi:hypothetical protein [Ensifer aridi]|uniref:hypothetical protein n=1 Tax=Ensifer aridi TaxID=1708715 RepID=UPI000614AF16|nr:hypothetical protein [Ensifer aridi]
MAKYLDERGDPASATHDAEREEFSAEEAKQGRHGTGVLAVLLGGLLLAFAVWGAVEIWGESTDIDPTAETEQVQPSTEQTGSINQEQSTPPVQAPVDRDPTAQTGTGGPSQQVSPNGTEK